MEEQQNKSGTSYGTIFKSTALFGFVQVFNIITKVGINKVVAFLLGAEGMGIIGLFHSAIRMLQTGAGLGVSQSAVRDISEANGANDSARFSRTISVTNRVIIFTSLFGIVLTIVLSPFLSRWSFGNSEYTLSFIWISLVVGLHILSEGQLAILKGMRQLRSLAKASMIGSFVGLITAVPFYYFFGKGGIVPSLLISAFSALFFSNLYVRRIQYDRIKLKLKEVFAESRMMITMGISLMLVSFIGFFFDLVVSSFISNTGSLSDVGYYHAGTTIIGGYFGIVITSMTTDYYPRISAINKDNTKLQREMNRQAEAGLIMLFPLAVMFVFLSRLFVNILYSNQFYATIDYTDWAMIGTLITVVSNCLGMILLAKQASKIFIISVLSQRAVNLGIYLLLYKQFGLLGLGFSYIALAVIHIILMSVIMQHFYKIHITRRVGGLLGIELLCVCLSIYLRSVGGILSYVFGSLLVISTIVFSYLYMKRYMKINILQLMLEKLKIKKNDKKNDTQVD